MKISLSLLAATATAKGGMKEWEVQNAYFAEKEIVLSNTSLLRSNKQWHACGRAPPKPVNGHGVKCVGNTCIAVCPIGWRSQGRWKIQCKANNTWSATKFSPCVTCPDISDELKKVGQRGVQFQSIFDARNKHITQFFCGDNTKKLEIKGKRYNGGQKKNLKCLCKNGQNGDPAWKKSCSWYFYDAPWSKSDIQNVQCKSKKQSTKPSTTQITKPATTQTTTQSTTQSTTQTTTVANPNTHRFCEELNGWIPECTHCYSYIAVEDYFLSYMNNVNYYEDYTCEFKISTVCDSNFKDKLGLGCDWYENAGCFSRGFTPMFFLNRGVMSDEGLMTSWNCPQCGCGENGPSYRFE